MPAGKKDGTHSIGGQVGPEPVWILCRRQISLVSTGNFSFRYVLAIHCVIIPLIPLQHKTQTYMTSAGFFVFSCTVSVLHPYLFLSLDCPAFCLLSLLTTHNTTIHLPCGIFFCSLDFICTSLSWLSWLCLLCFTVQHTTQTFMPPAGFEPTIPAGKRPQTYAVGRAATNIGRIQTPDRLLRNLVTIPTELLRFGGKDRNVLNTSLTFNIKSDRQRNRFVRNRCSLKYVKYHMWKIILYVFPTLQGVSEGCSREAGGK